MYEDAELLERGPLLRASDYLSDADTSIVVVVTAGARSPPPNPFNPFQSFIATVLVSLGSDRTLKAGRVFTVR